MNIILLSGGSGKRLWPLSNETRSKQFLKLLKNGNGELESMVQRVYRQIKEAIPEAEVVIATSATQYDSIRNQLGEQVDIVLEPERRNTFPAITLSVSYLFYEKGVNKDEPVIVLPVDPFAEQVYFTNLKKLEQCVRSHTAELVLMGVKPTYPSEKYGYIIPGFNGGGCCLPVERFKEKPSLEEAKLLVDAGALWNCGVFAFPLGFVLDCMKSQLPVHSYQEAVRRYGELHRESFDYEIVEQTRSIAVVEYSGKWADLGTWNTLTEQMSETAIGNVLQDDTNQNTHVVNELDIPVVVMGAKNMVVAASRDGILVADKQQSSYMKPIVERISQRPMFEERRWGEYRVVDFTSYADGTKSLTKRMLIQAGEQLNYQYHRFRQETWTVISGEGDFYQDGKRSRIRAGDVVIIPRESRHTVRAVTDMELIEVQVGTVVLEEDEVIVMEK